MGTRCLIIQDCESALRFRVGSLRKGTSLLANGGLRSSVVRPRTFSLGKSLSFGLMTLALTRLPNYRGSISQSPY
jgi:hypothetical protein